MRRDVCLPGTIGFTQVTGAVSVLADAGCRAACDHAPYRHCFVVLDDGTAVEARPRGARIFPLERYLDGRPLAFGWLIPLSTQQRSLIVANARGAVGARHGLTDYAAVALTRARVTPAPVRRHLAGPRLLPAQLCDEVYRRSGVHLFTDGRPRGDVTVGDLYARLVQRRWGMGSLIL